MAYESSTDLEFRQSPVPSLAALDFRPGPRRSWSKLCLDKFGAGFGLIALGPVLLLIMAAMALTQGRPIFFRHTRVGRGGRTFECLKFRTMVPEAQEILAQILESDPIAREEWLANYKFDNDPRVTRIGHFLRRTSLDELPQLWNVLVGDMSLVGPRPVTPQEAGMYGPSFAAYKAVSPGLTGLWQVSGRSTTTYRDRVRLDLEYLSTMSFAKDIEILLKTVVCVLQRRGAL